MSLMSLALALALMLSLALLALTRTALLIVRACACWLLDGGWWGACAAGGYSDDTERYQNFSHTIVPFSQDRTEGPLGDSIDTLVSIDLFLCYHKGAGKGALLGFYLSFDPIMWG